MAIESRKELPTRAVCRALGVSHASLYRKIAADEGRLFNPSPPEAKAVRRHPRALSDQERDAVLAILHEERFADMSPASVYATLLDEGVRVASISTMYRILRSNGQVRERRRQAVHPKRNAPELVATGPNQVWTWDITHLQMTVKGSTLKLYVCMDLFSRFIVGWYLSMTESSVEARHVFEKLAKRHCIDKNKLILHADNGGPMRGQPLADLLETLGIERSHSRPRTSNDNAFSESQFKTMKYRPTYPRRFCSEPEARGWCREFFVWYNNDHRHESLAFFTPKDVFTGAVEEKLKTRAKTLTEAFDRTPNRFVRGMPTPKSPPQVVAINLPKPHRSEPQISATQLQEVAKE